MGNNFSSLLLELLLYRGMARLCLKLEPRSPLQISCLVLCRAYSRLPGPELAQSSRVSLFLLFLFAADISNSKLCVSRKRFRAVLLDINLILRTFTKDRQWGGSYRKTCRSQCSPFWDGSWFPTVHCLLMGSLTSSNVSLCF